MKATKYEEEENVTAHTLSPNLTKENQLNLKMFLLISFCKFFPFLIPLPKS
jgi:hypothetical protein